MTVQNSTQKDIPEIFRLYKLATDFQKDKFPENQWPEFDLDFITKEVRENRQFKVVIDDKIACIWAITFNDPEIWGSDDNNDSIYIHRIATNPEFRGNNFVQKITDWAQVYAAKKNKKLIRMDTGGKNERLIKHYTNCGFTFLGIKRLDNSPALQKHYRNADICYFEIELL